MTDTDNLNIAVTFLKQWRATNIFCKLDAGARANRHILSHTHIRFRCTTEKSINDRVKVVRVDKPSSDP